MINGIAQPYFSNIVDRLTLIFETLGGALIGASAISFGLIMVAMQINIDRVPFRLFRILSLDKKLLFLFIAAFCLSLLQLSISLFLTKNNGPLLVEVTLSIIILVVILIVLAYRKALYLIDPINQINILVKKAQNHLAWWGKAADLECNHLKKNNTDKIESSGLESIDIERLHFFKKNPNWIIPAQNAVENCLALAEYYSRKEDYHVTKQALNAIILINSFYIPVKGKSFLGYIPTLEHSERVDVFVEMTLQLVNRYLQPALHQHIEVKVDQALQTFKGLCLLYLTKISCYGHNNSQADLAARYLMDVTNTLLQYQMIDSLLMSLGLLGMICRCYIEKNNEISIPQILGQIAILSHCCAYNQKSYPGIYKGISEMSDITFHLLSKSNSSNIDSIFQSLNSNIKFISEKVLSSINNGNEQSHYLGKYYSTTSSNVFLVDLTLLCNMLLENELDNQISKNICSNIAMWSNFLYEKEKVLFQLAISNSSSFIFDIMGWIGMVVRILLAVSTVDFCSENNRDLLRKNAITLFNIYSEVPEYDQQIVNHLDNYQISNEMFSSIKEAYRRGCTCEGKRMCDIFLRRGMDVCKYVNGYNSLKMCCYGLAYLIIKYKINIAILSEHTAIMTCEQQLKNAAIVAKQIREKIKKINSFQYHEDFSLSIIEQAIACLPKETLSEVLSNIATILER